MKPVGFFLIAIVTLCVSYLLDDLLTPSFPVGIMEPVLLWITQFGSAIAVLFVMTSLLLWDEHKREWIPALWVSLFFALGIVYALKFIFARERPLGEEHLLFGLGDYSFPSAHTASSFVPLPILQHIFPRFVWFWFGFALTVGFTRLFFGFHYFSDVVGGAFIGYGIGYLIYNYEKNTRMFKRWIFSK